LNKGGLTRGELNLTQPKVSLTLFKSRSTLLNSDRCEMYSTQPNIKPNST